MQATYNSNIAAISQLWAGTTKKPIRAAKTLQSLAANLPEGVGIRHAHHIVGSGRIKQEIYITYPDRTERFACFFEPKPTKDNLFSLEKELENEASKNKRCSTPQNIKNLAEAGKLVLSHTSTIRRYCYRTGEGYVETYSGQFGKGYCLIEPNWRSTKYSYVTYYTQP